MHCAWEELLAVLPPALREEAERQGRDTLQEIRLRKGEQIVFIRADGRSRLRQVATEQLLQFVLNMACRYSPWMAASLQHGYVTLTGGHRIGVCGDALVRSGRMLGFSAIDSMNIRVAREFSGIGNDLGKRRGSLLLLGPPGSGKTTMLRDVIRRRSARENIAVVDERGELFPAAAGFDRGENTDVLRGCDKGTGIETLLRTMTPQCIAVDEITARSDCEALIRAGRCGVSILATAHAASLEDLRARALYARLLDARCFETAVVMRLDKSWYTERMIG